MNSIIDRVRDTPKPSTPVLVFSKVVGCILPIVQIVIGAVYLNDCPHQPYIPIYLIVAGVFGLFLALLVGLPCAKQSNTLSHICTSLNSLILLFLFCWFITGNVWIYSIYQPNYVKNTTDLESYCNKTLYLFAFWSTTAVYILVGLFLFFGCCALFCSCICGSCFLKNI